MESAAHGAMIVGLQIMKCVLQPFLMYDRSAEVVTRYVKHKVLLLVILVVVAFVITRFEGNENPRSKENVHKDGILFTQIANDRGGNYWEYKLSNEKVIKEIEHYYSRSFLNFGPAERQNWVFELVNAGEVTITWQEYEGGGFVGDSYEITYYFDEEGKYTVISDSREDVR